MVPLWDCRFGRPLRETQGFASVWWLSQTAPDSNPLRKSGANGASTRKTPVCVEMIHASPSSNAG